MPSARPHWLPIAALTFMTTCLATGCVHHVAFDREGTAWHYSIPGGMHEGAALVAVIEPDTASATYEFSSALSGLGHTWIVAYGQMLGEIVKIELPQLVGHHETTTTYTEPDEGDPRIVLRLTVPRYEFQDGRAYVVVNVEAFGPGRVPLHSRSYAGLGRNVSAAMFGTLFAYRQAPLFRSSSLEAFQNAFDRMRPDLLALLEGRSIEDPDEAPDDEP